MKTYGAASAPKHATVRGLGAAPIDYRARRLDRLVRALEPEGVDYVFDGVGGRNIGLCIGALRKGGTVVGFGFVGAPGILSKIGMFANLFIGARLRGRSGRFYGITTLYRRDRQPFHEDLPKIFALLVGKKIDPLVTHTFPLLEARQAIELLATISVRVSNCLTLAGFSCYYLWVIKSNDRQSLPNLA